MTYEDILQIAPYSLCKEEKEKLLTERLIELTEFHKENCTEYGHILNSITYSNKKVSSYKDLPFLPVRLFKELPLKSVPDKEVVKIMTSSGTSGQAVSKIYLDRATSANQQKTMVKIVSDFTGVSRMPMIIIDCPSVVKNRTMFSARGAGILGFSIFGSKKIYALNDEMKLDVDGISKFLTQHKEERILLFGFTFMIWQYFYKELIRLKDQNIEFDLSNAIMIHGGGWKKLISEAVSPEEFHARLKDVCGLDDIHDYYGMVEQTGCIYMQCACGHLHASIFSDVIIRRPEDFSICDIGEPGIIQVVSTIPESYPGHLLLTEDRGVILGEDDCPCGRKGKYFKVLGRLQNAEIRGCSDTYAADYVNLTRESEEVTINSVDQNESNAVPDKISYLVGNKELLMSIAAVHAKIIFDKEVLAFCDDLSKELMTLSEAKKYSDVVALGFWLRKSSIRRLRERFAEKKEDESGNFQVVKIGKGVAFHIAPSNVPVNFAYSLFAGLLTGNANVVRLPSKAFPQVEIICRAIRNVLKKYETLKSYIVLVRYGKERDINDYLSNICNVRIVWGGDVTIAEIRKSPLRPRSTEITFADRYSLAVIDAGAYLNVDHKDRVARDFYNDTYLFDQNACTSPRVVVWCGRNIEKAKELFWEKLYELVKRQYIFQPIQGVDKLSQMCISAIVCNDENLHFIPSKDNRITRIQVSRLTDRLMHNRGNSGYFYEYDMKEVLELNNVCDDIRCQTIGFLGDKTMFRSLVLSGIRGVDRIVPIGQTTDFDFLWDGYNLVENLTRTVVIR